MNKKIKFIIPCLVVLITISVSIIISISKEKVMTTNKAVSGIAIYVNNGTSYVSQSSVPTGSYYLNTSLSHCVAKGEINSYNNTTGAVSYSLGGSDRCYLYFDQGTVSMQVGVASESIIDLAKNDSTNLAYDDYGNVRYIGANPNNYACFSNGSGGCINYDKDDAANKPAGLFRIIGVFNEDTHEQRGKQLVKLISADKLGKANLMWDYKFNGVGSSITDCGTNNWSDSQLMYMLNGNESMYDGYNESTRLHTGYSYNTSTYYISDGRYNIYQLYNGKSYLTGNGATSLNVPASVTTSAGYTASTNTSMQTLTTTQANMIATVTWHLGGYPSGSILSSEFYSYERGSMVSSGHATTWIGKIGLMYPSDYGYAIGGGTTYNRNVCLTSFALYGWSSYSDCYANDWLLYVGTRTGMQGTAIGQWTISPYTDYTGSVFNVCTSGNVSIDNTSGIYSVRPTFYLNEDVYIIGGSGTSTDPYRVGIPTGAEQIISLASKDTTNLATDDYGNIRFIGKNPNNYACLSSDGTTCINYDKDNSSSVTGGLFRIIGVFNEDTHGVTGKQLVKLITADTLFTTYFDYKKSGIGSSTTGYGSNDWSDSQLMYMLNGSEGNNKGYQSLTPVYGTTAAIRTFTYNNNNVYYDDTNGYYFYTNYLGNSYLSAGDGTTTSSRLLNVPASVANGSNYSSSKYSLNSLVSSQISMIKDVVWHIGGYSSTFIKTSALYTYERGSTVYSGHATTWIGKIGLMYPSDYGYATGGGTTYTRNQCLTSYNLGNWNSYTDCGLNNWLLSPGARTKRSASSTNQWTISQYSSGTYYMFYVGSGGVITAYYADTSYAVRPSFYLDPDVSLAGGSGTSTDPYIFTM